MFLKINFNRDFVEAKEYFITEEMRFLNIVSLLSNKLFV